MNLTRFGFRHPHSTWSGRLCATPLQTPLQISSCTLLLLIWSGHAWHTPLPQRQRTTRTRIMTPSDSYYSSRRVRCLSRPHVSDVPRTSCHMGISGAVYARRWRFPGNCLGHIRSGSQRPFCLFMNLFVASIYPEFQRFPPVPKLSILSLVVERPQDVSDHLTMMNEQSYTRQQVSVLRSGQLGRDTLERDDVIPNVYTDTYCHPVTIIRGPVLHHSYCLTSRFPFYCLNPFPLFSV
jgi:hypothetical protein